MEHKPQVMPRPLHWLVIALLTLTLSVALATPGPGIDFSKDESLSTTLVLQKKISNDDPNAVDAPDAFEELLAAITQRLTSREATANPLFVPPLHLAVTPQVILSSAAPRAPPRA
ncbi:MAG: hypothetical protein ACO3PV_05040 [Pseudohongiellaceae bacterium]